MSNTPTPRTDADDLRWLARAESIVLTNGTVQLLERSADSLDRLQRELVQAQTQLIEFREGIAQFNDMKEQLDNAQKLNKTIWDGYDKEKAANAKLRELLGDAVERFDAQELNDDSDREAIADYRAALAETKEGNDCLPWFYERTISYVKP